MRATALVLALSAAPVAAQQIQTYRPFGPLREQADIEQHWLDQRMKTVLPALMKKHGVDMWVVPMREYNEDPVFSSIVSATTMSARRRPIYLLYDPCALDGTRGWSGRWTGAGTSRAVGRRAVAGPQEVYREAQSKIDRDRRVARLC